jgi:hypothetical protein
MQLQLSDVLSNPTPYPGGLSLFILESQEWGLDTPCVMHGMNEIDDPDEVAVVGGKRFQHALPIATIQEIVTNARMQVPNATPDTLLKAFLYYYDNDGFIDLLS